jgi:hypothetical protein
LYFSYQRVSGRSNIDGLSDAAVRGGSDHEHLPASLLVSEILPFNGDGNEGEYSALQEQEDDVKPHNKNEISTKDSVALSQNALPHHLGADDSHQK